jgi:hypothetical protein
VGGGLKSRYRDPISQSLSSPNSLLESKRVLTADLVEVTSFFPVRKVRVLGAVLEKTPVQRKTAGHDGFIANFRQPLVEDVFLKAILDKKGGRWIRIRARQPNHLVNFFFPNSLELQTEILGSQLGFGTHEIPWGKGRAK